MDFKHLYKKSLKVQMYRQRNIFKGSFREVLKGEFMIDLKDLKNKCTIEGKYKMNLNKNESKRSEIYKPEFDVRIMIRTPVVDKEYKELSKQVFKLTKIYKQFDIKTDYYEEYKNKFDFSSKNQNVDINMSQSVLKTQNPNVIKNENNNSININTQKENHTNKQISTNTSSNTSNTEVSKINNISNVKKDETSTPIPNADEFSKMEIEDPDYIDSLNSLQVLKYKLQKVDEEISKIEGRAPMELRQKKLKISCKLKKLTDEIESGSISLNNYLEIQILQYKKDAKLLNYFKHANKISSAKLVEERMAIIKKEIDEGSKMVKK